ncbi:beta strand repeat-containing protein [Tsuneonella rigui]|uniref:beta strand repeat-containing protein n=1 Tax=Tsuneonella rigui TaxID=1708790 RepID=UPI000F7F8F6C|nr:S-layer family protein [Tsuneonella rigui]
MDRTASNRSRARRRNAALLSGCALGLVLSAHPQAAAAQDATRGFQGAGSVGAGSVTITTGSQNTTIDVGSAQAVVNWTPTDTSTSGTIDFLPEDYSASFISSNLSEYTVLNRILPGGSAKIGINGHITSSASNGDGGQNVGGNVWFYTPNGFVVGPRATIQVGGLVMTTNDIVFGSANTGGDDLTDVNGNVLFRGTTPGSSIVINPGAQITGTSFNSYIALVSPRIEQGGYVSADGSIAYVAGNQVDLKINAGNFDIVVGEGAEDANGIVHTGTTTGFRSSPDSRMQFVAVPKNTALTMLLSGSIGYIPAGSSYYDGGAIVLTAGDLGSPDGNIDIGATRFTSGVDAHATGSIKVAPPTSNSTEGYNEARFESYASLSADKSIELTAVGGSQINADRGLNLYSRSEAGDGGAISITAGPAELIPPDPEAIDPPQQFTSAGYIRISGGLSADAGSYGGTSEDGTTGLDSHAGSITLAADGGTIDADYAYLYARGEGGFGTKQGGDGYGGTIDVHAGLGGAIYTNYLSAQAEGHGGGSYEYTETDAIGGHGGVGRGGAVTIADSSGSFDDDPTGGLLSINEFSLDVTAIGGNSLERASGLGGDAFGGTIDFTIDRQNQNFGYIYGYARAIDGDGGAEDPIGGDITMTFGGGAAVTLNTLYLDAGAEASINSPAGAFGKGGTIDLTVRDGASLDVFYDTDLNARADVSYYYYDTLIDSSPDLTGGTIKLTADGGRFTTSNLEIDVSANNVGATTSAGFAHGGTAVVTAANEGSIATLLSGSECSECFSGGYFEVDAEGYGTSGLSANLVTGGDITLSAQSGGTISAASGEIDLYAGTSYGSAETSEGVGVTGQGGTIAIDAIGGTILTGLYADVSGDGGDADNGGGSGTGGTINVRVLEGGALENALFASASGYGGYAYVSGNGGDGTGGRLTFQSDDTASFTNFGLEFYGEGQGGTSYGGNGGDGTGGSAQVDILGGTHDWYDIYLNGAGRGGYGYGEGGGFTGSGYGSVDGLNLHIGGGADMQVSYIGLDARASAGADGDVNEAIGGNARLLVDQLATLTADSIGINASGSLAFEERSSDSFNTTPNAAGGSASAVADSGTIRTPFLEVVANGQTGAGLSGAGTAKGGSATVGASDGGLIDIIDGGFDGALTDAAISAFSGLTIEAKGLGAEGPFAADATGGTATLYTAGGTINSVSGITVNADADAGDFAYGFGYEGPANGFNATGGTASVEMRTGGSGGGAINAPSLTITAQGLPNGSFGEFPAVQGAGGIGQGGNATLAVAQGALTTGDIIIDATGFGGVAAENLEGDAYASGSGTGGTATFRMTGGSVDTTALTVVAQGIGAGGVGDTEGATASLAGTGTGGTARFIASGGTLNNGGDLRVEASGFGGEGGFNPNSAPGGDGADGFGGTATFTTPSGGSASLNIGGEIRIAAEGRGGDGAFSYSEEPGTGGSATGGTAAMNLADIPFQFGAVVIDANGVPGTGTVGGDATGGTASFSLVDTLTTAIAPRVIESLNISGASYAGAGAVSVGGAANFAAQVGNLGSGLTITNDLSLYAAGDTGPAGFGIVGAISGAPVTVGGQVSMITPRDAQLTISGAGALNATGNLFVSVGGRFSSTGLISTGGNALVRGDLGIDMTDLAAGGTTSLTSFGPVVVSHDLRSVGPVTVSGGSVLLRSLGGLTFADADALDGNLEIETAGDLLLAAVDATGSVTLTSNGGSIHNTGAVNGVGISYTAAGNVVSDTTLASGGALSVDAGGTFTAPGTVSAVGNVSLSADLGMNLAGVVSGGTTDLRADAGALTISSLTSPGAVTASAQSVSITSPGALSFTDAQATAGNLAITTAGNLALAQGGASGSLSLSSGGSVTGTGPITAGGNASVTGATGVSLAALTSGGATSLTAPNGNLTVTDLNSAGPVTASARGVSIGSSGALTFADLEATAGDAVVQTVGNLTVNTVDATGLASLTSTGGALGVNGAINAHDIALSSLASLALGNSLSAPGQISLTSTSGAVSATSPITAGGNLAVSGNSGITLGTASSGGTTSLTAANGAISVTNLSSAGAVTARARSIGIGSAGALSFADLDATAGNIAVQTAGNLAVATVDATGSVTLTSPGGTASGAGPIVAGGNLAVAGNTGVSLGTATSGGTTSLASANGAVGVTNLNSSGAVTASGRSVAIGSTGALTFADLDATAGNVAVQTAGNLTVATVNATGSVALTSTGGAVSGSGPVVSGGNLAISGNSGIALGTATSGGTTSLASVNGAVGVTNLNSAGAVTASGRSVTIGSTGALTFADLDATAGNIAVQTAGNLAFATVDATGSVSLVSTGGALAGSGAIHGNGITLGSLADLQVNGLDTAGAISLTSTGGAVSATAPVTAGGNLAVSGLTGVSLGTASSGGTTALTSANGAVAVTNLASAGPVTASGRSINIGSTGALTFADLDATAGNIAVQTAGNLALGTVDATGSVTLTSTGGALQTSGVINGNGIALSSLASLQLNAALATAGALSLTSTSGSVTATAPLSAGGNFAASGQTGVSLGTVASGGTTSLTAANGAVAVTALSSTGALTASGRSIDVRSPGALTVANAQATAGNLNLQAAQALTVGNASATGAATLTAGTTLSTTGTLAGASLDLNGANVTIGGQATASQDLTIGANQLFTLNGVAAAKTVTVNTGDIAIAATGRLGTRGLTQSILLRNRTTTKPMNIGGTGVSGEFSLDKAEAARLFADQQITFVSRIGEGAGGDARVGDLALTFGNQGNVGSGGTIKVDAGGVVTVNGAVALTTVSDADTFAIDPTRIDVIAGSGSIVMKNAGGTLMGTLELSADRIGVADQTTLDTIASLSDFAAISSALDKPGSAGPDGGYLQAGTINLIAGSGVFIQNGGATTEYADRRGFRANALNIDSEGTNTQIAINGVIVTPTGELVGLDTQQGVSINGVIATDLAKGAPVTINGCAAGVNCGIPEYTFGGLSADELEQLLATADDPGKGTAGQPLQVEETRPLITPPLVDEPITGVGNDDLWQVKCTPDGDKNCPAEEGS